VATGPITTQTVAGFALLPQVPQVDAGGRGLDLGPPSSSPPPLVVKSTHILELDSRSYCLDWDSAYSTISLDGGFTPDLQTWGPGTLPYCHPHKNGRDRTINLNIM